MFSKYKTPIIWSLSIFGVLLMVVLLILATSGSSNSTKLDSFAQCLKDKGAVFYGAFWCPHCQKQKELFGASVKFLPYIECSTPDGREQLPVCKEKGVDGYPTWTFADGTKEGGEVPLEKLAEKTGCVLPK